MDYEPYDSSGTDDDLPPPRQNRVSRGGRISGNGRPSAVGSVPYPRMYDETNMGARIHQLEQEAYTSILRAFKAQADVISWEKEDLITWLRKELGVTNEEHREILNRVNADETIRRIRDWRQSVELQPGLHGVSQTAHDHEPSPSISAFRKKQKIAPSLPSQSFGVPSPSFHPQLMGAANEPSSSAGKRGPLMSVKGKKQKTMLPGASSMKMHYPTAPSGRGQFGRLIPTGELATEPVEGNPYGSLIGRKVRTRWPADNNFYEAIITEYNHAEGKVSLVYDMGTASETWEWIKLAEIPPEDIQWEGEDPGIFHHGSYGGGLEPRMNRSLGRNNSLGAGRGRGLTKGQFRKDFPPSQNGISEKSHDDIQLLHTDTLIKEVERIFSASHPDSVEVEKAKTVLKEHEQALSEAITRLGDLSGVESDEDQRFVHAQAIGRE